MRKKLMLVVAVTTGVAILLGGAARAETTVAPVPVVQDSSGSGEDTPGKFPAVAVVPPKSTFSSLAAGGWCGAECDFKDPSTYVVKFPGGPSNYGTCQSDAKTIYTYEGTAFPLYVELRYSPACQTTWARATKLYSIRIESYNASGKRRAYDGSEAAGPATNNPNWTTMLDDHNLHNRACVLNHYVAPSDQTFLCTKKY